MTSFRHLRQLVTCTYMFTLLTSALCSCQGRLDESAILCDHALQGNRGGNLSLHQTSELVVSEILRCEWSHVVVVSGPESEDQSLAQVYAHLLRLLHQHRIYVIEYVLHKSASSDDMLASLRELNEASVEYKSYIFLTELAPKLIQTAQTHYCHGKAIQRHVCQNRIIIVTTFDDIHTLEEQLKYIVFDNVIIFATGLSWAFPLMWRENRTRQLDVLDLTSPLLDQSECRIMPNLRNGLNNRTLQALTKEWAYELYKVHDPTSGEIKYHGFLIDVLDTLAETLNFTYVHVPGPYADDQLSWEEYPNVIGRGEVDFGSTLWPSSTVFYFNHSTTFNVIFAAFTGAYIYEELTDGENGGSEIFIIFSPTVYLVLLSCFALSVFQYIAVTLCAARMVNNCKTKQNQAIYFVQCHCKRDRFASSSDESRDSEGGIQLSDLVAPNESSNEVRDDIQSVNQINPNSALVQRSLSPLSVAFDFLGAVWNQASGDIPTDISARIVFGAWCITVGFLSAQYNGSLTADFIEKPMALPFTTFQEMLDRGDVKWGIPYDVSLIRVLKASPPGSILRRVYEGAEIFTEDNFTQSETQDAILKKTRGKRYFVAITLRYILEGLQRTREPNMILLKDDLMRNDLGFIMPKDSQLIDIFNQQLSKMTMSGVMGYLQRKWNVRTSGASQPTTCTVSCRSEQDGDLKFEDLKGFLYVCGLAVFISMGALIAENVYARYMLWRHKYLPRV